MNAVTPKKISEHPQFCNMASQWFSQKWGIPMEAYRESMQQSISQKTKIPQWYIILDEQDKMIAGAGIIDNDFHDRKDLSPNLCALFVEEEHRKQGIARSILDYAREDIAKMDYAKLYLVTDHTAFYEKCEWDFLTMVKDDDGNTERMYVASAL